MYCLYLFEILNVGRVEIVEIVDIKPVDDVDIEIAMTRNDESSKLFEKSILAHLENAQI